MVCAKLWELGGINVFFSIMQFFYDEQKAYNWDGELVMTLSTFPIFFIVCFLHV